MGIKLREHLINFKKLTYVKEEEKNFGDYVDCALGTNPFGYPTTVNQIMDKFDFSLINKYPDYPYKELKKALIRYWSEVADLKDTNFKIGNGSMDLIERINKMFIDKNSKVLGYCPQFPDYVGDVLCCNGIYEYVYLKMENNYKFTENHLLSALNRDYTLIYIDNPNNPTGQVIPISVIKDIVEAARELDVCVVVDEAYGDFMEKDNSAITLVNKFDNLMVIRSFSKGFGLAGIRVGYLVTGDLLSDYFSKVEEPFGVNCFGYYAAILALKDDKFINECKNNIKVLKQRIMNACTKLHILETDMQTPIMTLMHPNSDLNLYREFFKHNILTEAGEDFIGLGKNFIRLRIPKDITKLIDAIETIEKNN